MLSTLDLGILLNVKVGKIRKMIEENNKTVFEENRKRSFSPKWLNQQWLKSHRVFEILLIVITIGSLIPFLILYLSDYRIGNMLLFSLIFVVTFILVARYHHLQITIILVACCIALLLAAVLLENFQWSLIVDHYLEWEVLAVVLGMSILVGSTEETGLFDWLIIRMLKVSKGKVLPLFIMTFLITLALSTVLANVTAMILISSMIFTICKGLDYDPTPFLLAAVLATDVAGMATLVSSLPAILVGTTADISFIDFILVSLPFVLISIPICILYLIKFFPPEKIPLNQESNSIDTRILMHLDPMGVIEDRKKFYLAAVSLGITIVGFALAKPLNIPIGVVAILGGILSMVLTRANEAELLSKLNWGALFFFAGLFVLVGILEETKILVDLANWLQEISGGNLFFSGFLILLITAVFSGVLDNIPVTAALLPIIKDINSNYLDTHPRYLWFILVFAGALGGGWTPFGSAAGILAVSLLAKEGRPLNFKSFIKCLAPISVLLLILSGIYLYFLAFILEVI
ncbi:MAG: SLC13 family permease [Candidatus Hodarchaeales archaeon]|jgi:Na+/H+ antiporter NhaD/arsenite permease-like protein